VKKIDFLPFYKIRKSMSLMSKCNNLSANNHIFNASGAVYEMGDPWSVVFTGVSIATGSKTHTNF
jgi:hypothetical protein